MYLASDMDSRSDSISVACGADQPNPELTVSARTRVLPKFRWSADCGYDRIDQSAPVSVNPATPSATALIIGFRGSARSPDEFEARLGGYVAKPDLAQS